VLIRHGETDWNLEGRYQGSMDIPLNPKGVRQAELLNKRMSKEKFDRIYSSDRIRAKDFASIIFKGKDISAVPGLREISFGVFEGMMYEEILREHKDVYSEWMKDPLNTAPPSGEDPGDFKKRVIAAFDHIASQSRGQESVAIVTHGGPISIIINSVSGRGEFWDNIPGNGSISIIEIKGGERRVVIFNDISHFDNE
jgi:broad specificity phosphatase PhoE